MAATAIRLAAGIASLGADELKSRLAAVPERVAGAEPAPSGASLNEGRPTVLNVATGLAVVAMTQASRLIGLAGDASARMGVEAGRVERLPGIGVATLPIRLGFERYQAVVWKLSETGRREALEGRRIILHLIDDTTTSSVKDIAQSAVRQVAESPEIAALVRSESAGVATGTVREMRTTSERADETVERRVRTWLHLLRADDVPEKNGKPDGDKPAA